MSLRSASLVAVNGGVVLPVVVTVIVPVAVVVAVVVIVAVEVVVLLTGLPCSSLAIIGPWKGHCGYVCVCVCVCVCVHVCIFYNHLFPHTVA